MMLLTTTTFTRMTIRDRRNSFHNPGGETAGRAILPLGTNVNIKITWRLGLS